MNQTNNRWMDGGKWEGEKLDSAVERARKSGCIPCPYCGQSPARASQSVWCVNPKCKASEGSIKRWNGQIMARLNTANAIIAELVNQVELLKGELDVWIENDGNERC